MHEGSRYEGRRLAEKWSSSEAEEDVSSQFYDSSRVAPHRNTHQNEIMMETGVLVAMNVREHFKMKFIAYE